MTRPAFAAGESVFGYLQRTSVPTERSNLTYENGGKLSILFPSSLTVNFPWLSTVIPFETILLGHLPYNVFSPYLSEDCRISLRNHYLNEAVPGIAQMTGIAACGPRAAGRLKICLECLRGDTKCGEGIGILRTVHLLPGLIHCPFHSNRLVKYCGRCFNGFDTSHAVRLLKSACRCGAQLVKVGPKLDELSEAAMLAIAEDALSLLNGALEGVTAAAMLDARSRRAKEMGLISLNGKINSEKLRSAMEHAGLSPVTKALGFSMDRGRRLAEAICGKRAVRSYLVNLIADLLLFKGVDGLKQYLAVAKEEILTERQREMVERGKAKVVRAISRYPNITRKSIGHRVSTRDLKLVIAYASSWFDSILPKKIWHSPPGSKAVKNKKERLTDHEMDIRLVEFIIARYREIISVDDLPPVTMSRLLRGYPCASIFRSQRGRLPLAALLVERLCESTDRDSLGRRRIKVWMPGVREAYKLSRSARKKLLWKYRRCCREDDARGHGGSLYS